MFNLKEVPIPDYSRAEDTINSVTHALGIPISIAAVVLCCVKLDGKGTALQYFAIAVYCFCMLVLYFGSAFYHGLKPGYVKQVARVLDHCNIFLMISGTLTAFYLLGVINANRPLAIGLCIGSWALSVVGILLTFMDQQKFRAVQMVMYMLIGWTAVIGMFSTYKTGDAGKYFTIYVLVGGLVYTLGTVFYGIGKKIKYMHCVFHVFILAGTILQFYGLYEFMI